MAENQILPIGIQDFEKLRRENLLYVDKTDLIFQLAKVGKPYFLSRPRRFGKSLLLSTFEAYFLGKKDLFKGLAIDELEKDWIKYPVINLSFAADNFTEDGSLAETLNQLLKEYEHKYGIFFKSFSYAWRLKQIIRKAYAKTGKQVVILIDEYDKPILDALYTDLEEKNRNILRGLFSPLKDCDKYIRFLFITGITKVSHVNIFSGLNQLDDISMNEAYSSLCGITESELEKYFQPQISALAQKKKLSLEQTKTKLAEFYDGYHFTHDVEGVYNPFCLFKCFSEQDFGSYWFESGTPSFLVKTLQHQPLLLSSIINGRRATEDQFKNYDPDSQNMLPVIYQSGYLTIKDFQEERRIYTLDFPNKEIENGFLNVILKKFVKVPDDDMGLAIDNLCKALEAKDIDRALSIIKAAVADIPSIIKKEMCENYYESITHVMFRMTGLNTISELQSINGRSDIIVTTDDSVFIFELKMDNGRDFEAVADEALAQIDKNGYADRFAASGKDTFKIGLVFASNASGLIGWKIK